MNKGRTMWKKLVAGASGKEMQKKTPGGQRGESEGELTDLNRRWDKLKEWPEVREEVRLALQDPEKFDHGITLENGPQLFQTMRHCCNIRCMMHFSTQTGETFVTYYRRDAVGYISVWTINLMDTNGSCEQERLEVDCALSKLLFIQKYRVFVGFGPDMMLRVYTEANIGFQVKSTSASATTVLCLAFNQDTNEIITGCVGAVESWMLQGCEQTGILTKGRKFNFTLQKDDWVVEIHVDNKHKQLIVVCETALLVLNYVNNIQTHQLPNRHIGSLKCSCVYNDGEYLITGSGDGGLKVWNPVVLNQVHDFNGHHDAITSLQTHRLDPLLFSSSLDGSVQIWRMDNFQRFMKFKLGEAIYSMGLLGETQMFCQTLKEIKLYNLNQFFSLFAAVDSSVYTLKRQREVGNHPSRVVAACEDGSMRFFCPITGSTITILFPMPSFKVLTCFVYNVSACLLYVLLSKGEVMVIKCSCNPCQAVRILRPETESNEVLDLCIVYLMINHLSETLVFGGFRNGQICLLDAKHYRMKWPTQAHHGRVVCLETCDDMDHDALGLDSSHGYIMSGSNDCTIRLWRVDAVDYEERIIRLFLVQQFDFGTTPSKLILSQDVLCVTFKSSCALKMYKIQMKTCRERMDCPFMLKPMFHSSDYDHRAEVMSLDACYVLGIFLTSAPDGSVKVWDSENTLIRELSFVGGINGACFANSRGDILIGFQDNIMSVPLLKYLPLEKLEILLDLSFKDERREQPIPYDHKAKPWFDLRQIECNSLQLEKRLMFDKRPRTVSSKEMDSPDKMECVVFGEGGRFQTIYGMVVAEDANFAENIRKKSPQHRQKIQLGSLVLRKLLPLASAAIERSKLQMIGEGAAEEDEGLGEEIREDEEQDQERQGGGEIQIYDPLRGLSDWERRLLTMKRIIAPDGYIPNSVIRSILKQSRPLTPEEEDRWQPKPVPEPNPLHLPPGWGEKLRINEGDREGQISDASTESMERKFNWEEVERSTDSKFSSVSLEQMASPSPSTASDKSGKKTATPDAKYVFQSRVGAKKVIMDFKADEVTKKVPPAAGPKAPPEPKKQRPIQRGDMVLDEPIPAQVEDKKKLVGPDMSLLDRLMQESWFPKGYEYELTPAMLKLLQMLEMFGKNYQVHEKICEYIVAFHDELGMEAPMKKKFQEILLEQLPCEVSGVRSNCVRTLRNLGLDDKDMVTAVLPKLVDPSREVRQEAVLTLVELMGITNKTELEEVLQQLGVTRTLNSLVDEDYALQILHDKVGLNKSQSQTVIESFQDWVSDWITCSIPGAFEDEEYYPSVEGMVSTGPETGRAVQIVSPDGETTNVSHRRESDSQRSTSKADVPGGGEGSMLKMEIQGAPNELPREYLISTQGRRPSQASKDSNLSVKKPGWASETPVLLRIESRFRPKGNGPLYSETVTKSSQDARDSGRATGKSQGHFERQSSEQHSSERHSSEQQPSERHPSERHPSEQHPSERPPSERQPTKRHPSERHPSEQHPSERHPSERHPSKRHPSERHPSERVLSNRLIEYAKLGMDLDLHSLSASAESTEQGVVIPTEISRQTEIHSNEGLNFYDSGIGRDMSDSSSNGFKLGPVASYKKRVKERQLSPVKSTSNGSSPSPKKSCEKDKNWKQFFNSPSAVERKRLVMVKRDFQEGNMKRMSSLPPISYISADLPTFPGEAGLRLLHSVRLADKEKTDSAKHRVQSIPGRLGVKTNSSDSGSSNYGVLQMKWTTNVPVVPVSDERSKKRAGHMTRSHDTDLSLPPLEQSGTFGKPHDSGSSNNGVLQMKWTTNVPVVPVSDERSKKRAGHMTRSHDTDLSLPPLEQSGTFGKPHDSGSSNNGVLQMKWTTNVPVVPVSDECSKKRAGHMTRSHDTDLSLPPLEQSGTFGKPQLPFVDMTDLMRFPPMQQIFQNDYEWEKPMTPPTVTKSRTFISPVRRCAHEHMCRHYKLAKKKMHHYISENSPGRYHSQAKNPRFSNFHHSHLSKSNLSQHAALPPLKLRVLIDCIKVKS